MIMKQQYPMQKRRVLISTWVMLFLVSCTNPSPKSIDIDGNSYTTVKIGTKHWTGENLDVAHYRNGDSIPEIKHPVVWPTLTTGAWCYNENKAENGKTYGKLYNWYAVNDPRGLAPKGWHVATDAEWSELTDLLGGTEEAGGAVKAKAHWKESNDRVNNNKSGFAALPAGARRDTDGKFMAPGEYSRMWSSTEITTKSAWVSALGYFDAFIRRGKANKNNGFSVRCVKDKD
jgi:uncharacterized protein (TIGR02145 family)